MIPQRIMRPSIVHSSEQFYPRCSPETYHRSNQSRQVSCYQRHTMNKIIEYEINTKTSYLEWEPSRRYGRININKKYQEAPDGLSKYYLQTVVGPNVIITDRL